MKYCRFMFGGRNAVRQGGEARRRVEITALTEAPEEDLRCKLENLGAAIWTLLRGIWNSSPCR